MKETLEEAAERVAYDSTEENKGFPSMKMFVEGAKWMQERMYSEEEVFELLLKHQSDYRSAVRNTSPLDWSFDINKWFEQFKK